MRRVGLAVQVLHDGHETGEGVFHLDDDKIVPVNAAKLGNAFGQRVGGDDGGGPAGR